MYILPLVIASKLIETRFYTPQYCIKNLRNRIYFLTSKAFIRYTRSEKQTKAIIRSSAKAQ